MKKKDKRQQSESFLSLSLQQDLVAPQIPHLLWGPVSLPLPSDPSLLELHVAPVTQTSFIKTATDPLGNNLFRYCNRPTIDLVLLTHHFSFNSRLSFESWDASFTLRPPKYERLYYLMPQIVKEQLKRRSGPNSLIYTQLKKCNSGYCFVALFLCLSFMAMPLAPALGF